jgi:hypothetical protein
MILLNKSSFIINLMKLIIEAFNFVQIWIKCMYCIHVSNDSLGHIDMHTYIHDKYTHFF